MVNAIPQDAAKLKHEVAGFIRTVTQLTEVDQYARRAKPFCPVVLNIDPQYTASVLDKVRRAAAATGTLTEARPGCEPNLAIIFSNDGDSLVRAMSMRQPLLFAGLTIAKRRELFDSGRAVRWWYGTGTEGADGDKVDEEGNLKVWHASLVSTGVRFNLSATVVVVDITRAEGYPLDAIASYAAMVAFAQIKGTDGGLAGLPSVLGMFARTGARSDAQPDLTVWDRAYLHGLYHIAPDRPAWQQRSALAGAMIAAAQTSPEP